MIGFLAAGALGGIVTVGWPVYLHLRRRQKPRVQVVPSLLLFAHAPRPSRLSVFERIVLLVARAMFLVLLWAMVSQPYVETHLHLPLPQIGEEDLEECLIGIVLDDGLTSLHGPEGETRLDASRRWLRARIRGLPEHARVSVAFTSFPHPTRPMSAPRALPTLPT